MLTKLRYYALQQHIFVVNKCDNCGHVLKCQKFNNSSAQMPTNVARMLYYIKVIGKAVKCCVTC